MKYHAGGMAVVMTGLLYCQKDNEARFWIFFVKIQASRANPLCYWNILLQILQMHFHILWEGALAGCQNILQHHCVHVFDVEPFARVAHVRQGPDRLCLQNYLVFVLYDLDAQAHHWSLCHWFGHNMGYVVQCPLTPHLPLSCILCLYMLLDILWQNLFQSAGQSCVWAKVFSDHKGGTGMLPGRVLLSCLQFGPWWVLSEWL